MSVLIITSLALGACVEATERDELSGDDGRGLEDADGSVRTIPTQSLAAALRSPFVTAQTESRPYNCPADPTSEPCTTKADCTATNFLNECYITDPVAQTGFCGHHRPWGGDWAIDLFAKDISSCGQPATLRLSPGAMPGGTPPDRLRVQPSAPTPACGSQDIGKGGYDQTFTVYAIRDGEEHELGSVLIAHIDDPIYDGSAVADLDPAELQIGTVWAPDGEICSHADEGSCVADTGCKWNGTQCYNPCWDGCHLHMELFNASETTESCWQNMCDVDGKRDVPRWGADSVIGFVGGSDDGDMCPTFESDESLACGTWDRDLDGCDAHGLRDADVQDDTQDCAYYTTTGVCRARGTSNCQTGISGDCIDDESDPCSTWDGDVQGCDLHGIADPDPTNDTQDCAYYFISERCMPRGTTNCVADCDGCIGAGCAECYEQCPSTDPEL